MSLPWASKIDEICVIMGLQWKNQLKWCKASGRTSEEGCVVPDFGPLISTLQEKLNLSCIHSPMVTELMRGIRSQIEGLITGLPSREMAAMCLGLAHRWVPATALSHPVSAPLSHSCAVLHEVSLSVWHCLILFKSSYFCIWNLVLQRKGFPVSPTL